MDLFLKKIHIVLLGIVVVASSFPTLFAPKEAGAIFGIPVDWLKFEINPIMTTNTIKTSAEATVTAGATTGLLAKEIYKEAKGVLLGLLKRQILDVMVDQVVTWVQGGGEPRFITDWETFLGDIAQGAVGEFVEQIGAGFLCEPFSLQVRLNLLPVQRFGNNAPFSCTLDDIVQNVEGFYEDFRNGGWIAYNAQWQPQNNYYGALLIAWDARNNFVADKLAAAANNALANKGFLGTKRCYDSDTGQEVSESAISQNARERQVGEGVGSVREFTTGGEVNGSFRSATHTIVCEDTTPGGVVSAALEKAVGSDFEFIVNAQELGDYAAAIVNALVNRLVMEGVNGLRGVHSGGGSSYQPSRSSGTTYGGYGSVGAIPQSTRSAISNYTNTTGGSISGFTRTELVARLNDVLTRRNALRPLLTEPLNLTLSYSDVVQDTLSCHQTVPALRSGSIHDAILQKQGDAQNFLSFIQPVVDDNNDAIDEITQTIDQLNRMNDAQFRARINEFQVVFANTEPDIVGARLSQGSAAIQQIQTFVTPSVIADAQRDLDYCISQGGTAP